MSKVQELKLYRVDSRKQKKIYKYIFHQKLHTHDDMSCQFTIFTRNLVSYEQFIWENKIVIFITFPKISSHFYHFKPTYDYYKYFKNKISQIGRGVHEF